MDVWSSVNLRFYSSFLRVLLLFFEIGGCHVLQKHPWIITALSPVRTYFSEMTATHHPLTLNTFVKYLFPGDLKLISAPKWDDSNGLKNNSLKLSWWLKWVCGVFYRNIHNHRQLHFEADHLYSSNALALCKWLYRRTHISLFPKCCLSTQAVERIIGLYNMKQRWVFWRHFMYSQQLPLSKNLLTSVFTIQSWEGWLTLLKCGTLNS